MTNEEMKRLAIRSRTGNNDTKQKKKLFKWEREREKKKHSSDAAAVD